MQCSHVFLPSLKRFQSKDGRKLLLREILKQPVIIDLRELRKPRISPPMPACLSVCVWNATKTHHNVIMKLAVVRTAPGKKDRESPLLQRTYHSYLPWKSPLNSTSDYFWFKTASVFVKTTGKGEWMLSACVISTVRHKGGGVKVWRCPAGDTVGDSFKTNHMPPHLVFT